MRGHSSHSRSLSRRSNSSRRSSSLCSTRHGPHRGSRCSSSQRRRPSSPAAACQLCPLQQLWTGQHVMRPQQLSSSQSGQAGSQRRSLQLECHTMLHLPLTQLPASQPSRARLHPHLAALPHLPHQRLSVAARPDSSLGSRPSYSHSHRQQRQLGCGATPQLMRLQKLQHQQASPTR